MRVYLMTRRGVGPRENIYVLPGVGDPVGRLPDRVYTRGEETEFLSALDFLVLSMPLTRDTEGILGKAGSTLDKSNDAITAWSFQAFVRTLHAECGPGRFP